MRRQHTAWYFGLLAIGLAFVGAFGNASAWQLSTARRSRRRPAFKRSRKGPSTLKRLPGL